MIKDRLLLEASHKAVLGYLLTHKVGERYKMTTEIRKQAYSSIFNAVKQLQKSKLIELEKSRESRKNPKIKVKQYRLTRLGLVLACSLVLDWSEVPKVAEAHQDDFPLIFGKWKHFVKEGKEQDAIQRLHNAIDLQAIRLLRMTDPTKVESEQIKKWCREMKERGYEPSFYDNEYQVTKNFFMLDYMNSTEMLEVPPENLPKIEQRWQKATDEWRDMCSLDDEIREFIKYAIVRKCRQKNHPDTQW